MKVSKYLFFAALTMPLVLASCRGQISEKPPIHIQSNMTDQKKFDPQEDNAFFEDKRSQRLPVNGTIARGHLKLDKAYYEGLNEDSTMVTEIPVDLTKSFINRGQDRYDIFCSVCHGIAGDGQGIIMTGGYSYTPAPDFHTDRLRDMKAGHIYSVISNGIRTMPSYAHQIPVKDRWAIVAYVKALQKSTDVSEEEIKRYDVDLAALKQDYKEKQAAEEAKASEGGGGGEVSVERGKQIASENACQSCHTTDGTELVGPTWKNLYGSEVQFEDGSSTIADVDYLHESIVDPAAKIVEGFPPSMVPYDYLDDSEISSLIEYIKSLSDKEAPETDKTSGEATKEETSEEGETTEQQKNDNDPETTDKTAKDTSDTTQNLSASAQKGQELIDEFDCLSCHTIDKEQKDLAPPFKGLYGSEVQLTGDSTVTADEGYIKDSIQYPGNMITLG